MRRMATRKPYELAPEVLRDLTLTLRRGEKVALVGATGAGKSSIIKLLQRFYDPLGGRITIDGVDLRELSTRPLLPSAIAVRRLAWILARSDGQPD